MILALYGFVILKANVCIDRKASNWSKPFQWYFKQYIHVPKVLASNAETSWYFNDDM